METLINNNIKENPLKAYSLADKRLRKISKW